MVEAKMQGGDEYDAFSKKWRRWCIWKAGQLKKIKRGFHKRVRRLMKESLRADIE